MTDKLHAEKMGPDLSEASDRNLLNFYRSLLLSGQIDQLSESARKRLRRLKLISLERDSEHGIYYVLTPRALRLLGVDQSAIQVKQG